MFWRYFPLHPDTPEEGRSLEDLFSGTGIDFKAGAQRMKALTQVEGLPFNPGRSMTYNSRKAQELAKWAEDTTPDSDSFNLALYQAYFVDGVNLAKLDVLLQIVEECGLPVEEAREVFQTGSFSDAVDQDWAQAREFGVTGIPTFICGGYGLVGAQSFDDLLSLIEKGSEQLP